MPTLRDFAPADAAAVAAIYTESILARDSTMDLDPVEAAHVQAWVDAFHVREALLVLGDDGTGVLGWGIVKRYTDRPGYRYAAETALYLRRALVGRRTGHGTQLLHALVGRGQALGYHHLVAKIWAENAVSRALHEKVGFELVGVQREVGFVEGAWKDVAIYQRLLPAPGSMTTSGMGTAGR